MNQFSQGGENEDVVQKAQREIDSARGIMTENIERVLERGERIDLLVDKTAGLQTGAMEFRVRSRGLRRRMWWKNTKLMILLVFAVVFLIYLFVGMACGLPGMHRITRDNLSNRSNVILWHRLAILRPLVYKAKIANSGEGGRKSDI